MSLWSPEIGRPALEAYRLLVGTLGSEEAASEAISALAQVPVGWLEVSYQHCDPRIGYHAMPHNGCPLR